MKGNKKAVFAVAALAAAAALMLGIWYLATPQAQAGEKTVVVQVIHGDESSKDFTYRTDAENLGQVLVEENLAQDSLRQWWCVTKGGEWLDTGVDATPITDGDHFELTLSTY